MEQETKPLQVHIKWWVTLLLCIPAVYIIIQLCTFVFLERTYKTQTVVEDSLADSILCNGILGMNESEILYDGSGVLGYAVANGERVQAGATVAQVFATSAQAQQAAYAEALSTEIETLQKSQISSTGTDTAMLQGQVYSAALDMLDLLKKNDLREMNAARGKLQTAADKTQIVMARQTDFSARIEMLSAQRDAALLAGTGTPIAAPESGYFVAGQDSKQRVYTTQQLREMLPADLHSAAAQDAPDNQPTVAGKIIEDYRWRYFASVTAEQAAKFENRSTVTISFPDVSEEQLPASIESVTIDEASGTAKIELLCSYLNEDVVTLEHERARISFDTYNGLRIDKRALRVVDGVNGVYIRYGNMVRFCRIKILYQNDNYILAPLEYIEGENEVVRYDETIISGRDLYDGKTI